VNNLVVGNVFVLVLEGNLAGARFPSLVQCCCCNAPMLVLEGKLAALKLASRHLTFRHNAILLVLHWSCAML
jgi:hypothetical protein